MRRRCPGLPLLFLLVLWLAGCGSDDAAPTAGQAELDRLAARVAGGGGISDATWTRDVQDVALSLWLDEGDANTVRARRDHSNLAHIAGDMAARLAADPDEREATAGSDPLSLRIHDAFVQASGGGVVAYRAWVEGEGRDLLEERVRALQGERPPR